MGLASGKAEQSYFQGMMSVNWAIFVRFPYLDVSCYERRECVGGYARCQRRDEIMLVHPAKPTSKICIPPVLSSRHFSLGSSVLVRDGRVT